ncbi:HAMP domain-containing protein [Roseovarius ramblicola]|uniref:HAMP domain-containing protein n=1 Tax=Roseovarius ramblicola TaxID=2022336 RepID=A0ABV5I1R5_9RHOB
MTRQSLDESSPLIGRFDQSFLIHMIRDFFVLLVLVTALEFALKAGMVNYTFRTEGPKTTREVATVIAENVRSIMRNEGGPVAARTVYPILETNWNDLGYRIAITPAPVTTRSIEAGFGFTPEGIPREDRPEAMNNAATLPVTAEPFCLSCRSEAEVGDVLGEVVVRRDLATEFSEWVADMRLTGLLSLGKIVLHSVLLFLILRARLEPLLGLRAVVSRLARAYGGLTHRAEIRTADEFGVLARDLNLFLDRVCRLMEELDEVLQRVVTVNADILAIQGDLVEDLRAVVSNAEAQIETSERVFADLGELGDESDKLKRAMSEMIRLEERMEGIVETGSVLVQRIRPPEGEAHWAGRGSCHQKNRRAFRGERRRMSGRGGPVMDTGGKRRPPTAWDRQVSEPDSGQKGPTWPRTGRQKRLRAEREGRVRPPA